MEATASEAVNVHDDPELMALMNRAARVIEDAGLSAEDLIAELPEVQEELLRQDLPEEFIKELSRLHAALYSEE